MAFSNLPCPLAFPTPPPLVHVGDLKTQQLSFSFNCYIVKRLATAATTTTTQTTLGPFVCPASDGFYPVAPNICDARYFTCVNWVAYEQVYRCFKDTYSTHIYG